MGWPPAIQNSRTIGEGGVKGVKGSECFLLAMHGHWSCNDFSDSLSLGFIVIHLRSPAPLSYGSSLK